MPAAKTDHLAVVEESLLATRHNLQKQLSAVDTMIDNLRNLRDGSGEKPIPPVRPNEYAGMRAARALENYLRARREFRIPLSKAIADLLMGGVESGKPRGKKTDPASLISHALKIMLPNRTETFAWDPVTPTRKGLPGVPKGNHEILVWLSPKADEPRLKKQRRKA